MFLFLVLSSLTVLAVPISKDSTTRALDNCAYAYDSLANRLYHQDSIAKLEQRRLNECIEYSEGLEIGIGKSLKADSLHKQILQTKDENLKKSEDRIKQTAKQAKRSNIFTGLVAFTTGAVVGGVIVGVLMILK